MLNNAKNTSRGKNDEIKNGYSLKRRQHISWVPSPTKKKMKAKMCARDQTFEVGAEGEEGDWTSAGVSGSPE